MGDAVVKLTYIDYIGAELAHAFNLKEHTMGGYMITIIGTGHVFNLAEPVSFIVNS